MNMKKLFAVLSVFMFGASFASQAYAAATFPSTPYERTFIKSSARKNIGQQNAKLAAKYRAAMLNRFMTYTTYDSQSNDAVAITPEQIETAKKLYAEIQKFGFKTELTKNYYIYVEIPSNVAWKTPTLGFSCHYDTTPDIIGKGIKAQKIEKYDGKPIQLKNGHILSTETDPYLKNMIGKTIVTSDGTTMLSADDKAGVSVLVTFIQTLAENPSKKHGKIQIVITPNEDVGRSADFIEETPYNPDIAFDFDGGVNGEVVVGNFNAEKVIYKVHGVNGHQSMAAENGYRNAWKPACELGAACAQEKWLPNNSTGKQGYVELHHMDMSEGKANVAELDFRLRDFSQKNIDAWKVYADSVANKISDQFGVKIEREVYKQYGNVAESIHPQARQVVTNALQNAGITPNFKEERAGTTASMLMLKLGNGAYTLFTGQNNPHAFTEWLSEEDMYKAYLVALNLADEIVMMR